MLTLILSGPNSAVQCPGEARLSGQLETAKGKIHFRNEPVSLHAQHCIDVDREDQGGCISAYQVATLKRRGCLLKMALKRDPAKDVFVVQRLSFSADSYCPGWFDHAEHTYVASGAPDGDLVTDTDWQLEVEATKNLQPGQETLDRACFRARLTVGGMSNFISTTNRQQQLEGQLKNLVVSGTASSRGQVNRRCLYKKSKPAVARRQLPKKRARPQAATPVRPSFRTLPNKPTAKEPIGHRIRIDVGIADGPRINNPTMIELAYGKLFTPIVQVAPDASIGLGIVISNLVGEVHPRLLLGVDSGTALGTTIRFFPVEQIGIFGSLKVNSDALHVGAGLSLRF